MPSFFLMIRRPPRSTLFPSTPLFRSAMKTISWRRSASLALLSAAALSAVTFAQRSEEHTSELQSHLYISYAVFFFNDTATTEIYTLSLHAALPICHEDDFVAEKRLPGAAVGGGVVRGHICP